MEITFKNAGLKKLCESDHALLRKHGRPCARKLKARLADLAALACLEDIRTFHGRCHELSDNRKGQLSMELPDGKRLVFEPSDDPPPIKDGGGLDWSAVTEVRVVEIADYHE